MKTQSLAFEHTSLPGGACSIPLTEPELPAQALEPEQIQEFFETREGCVQTYGVGSTAVGCGLAPWAAWQARLRPGFMWAAAGTCL